MRSSQALRQALWDAAETLDADPAVAAVVLLCAGRTFIAGADVTEFGKPPVPPHLPDLVARIERAGTPWVAAIHGSALGGGFEVALGCRFRVAVASASVGLPEVTLGIVPGAGGTVRLPRLVPLDRAVELVTTGRPVKAPKALELGLIDAVLDGDLRAGAVAFASEALARPLPAALRDRPPHVPAPGCWEEAESAVRKRTRGEVAPLRALACVRRAVEADFDAAMAFERETFLDLRASPQAAAMRHVFFAERAAARPASLKGIEPRPVRSAAVIGGGTMGAGIAAALRDAGLPVTLVERDAAALERGLANLRAIFDGAVRRGRLTEDVAAARIAGVTGSIDYARLADTDLVVEAVFEELAVKRAVFARLGGACRPDAILATNTSYLDPTTIAAGLPHPERFIGLHFFSPANVMRLLEIVPTPDTAPDVLATGFALAGRLGKVPVQAGICDGFIGNRILKRYRAAAEDLVRAGVPIAAIDAAMRDFGFAMGPFEAQDLGGLDIAFLQREGARAAGRDVPDTLGDLLVRAGRKGRKTGGGWYDYAPGDRKPRPSPEVATLLADWIVASDEPDTAAIAEHLVAEMAAEGEAILTEGKAARASDIDLVEIHGYGFPRWRGGPMFHRQNLYDGRFPRPIGREAISLLLTAVFAIWNAYGTRMESIWLAKPSGLKGNAETWTAGGPKHSPETALALLRFDPSAPGSLGGLGDPLREDAVPVVLHADHRPAALPGLVEQRLGEGADVRVRQAVGGAVGELALGVVVQHQEAEARAVAGGGPFQHLAVAVGVAEGDLRPLADEEVDADRLAGAVVDEEGLGLAHQHRLAVDRLVLGDDARSRPPARPGRRRPARSRCARTPGRRR